MAFRPATRILVSATIAVVILAALATQTSFFSDALAAIGRMPAGAFLAALALHALVYLGRAARFRHFLRKGTAPLHLVFWIHCAHHLVATVLPARAGELSYVFYLNARCQVPASEGMASLIASRLLDFATAGAYFLGSVLILDELLPGGPLRWASAAAVVFVLIAAGGLGVMRFGGAVLSRGPIAAWLARPLPEGRPAGLRGLVHRILEGMRDTFEILRHHASRGQLLMGAAYSFAVWMGVFLFYWTLMQAQGFGEGQPLPHVVFGASFAVVVNLLPIAGIAGFGTHEAGWTLGFTMMGMPLGQAVACGLAVHLVTLANVIALGVLGHIFMGFWGASGSFGEGSGDPGAAPPAPGGEGPGGPP